MKKSCSYCVVSDLGFADEMTVDYTKSVKLNAFGVRFDLDLSMMKYKSEKGFIEASFGPYVTSSDHVVRIPMNYCPVCGRKLEP